MTEEKRKPALSAYPRSPLKAHSKKKISLDDNNDDDDDDDDDSDGDGD